MTHDPADLTWASHPNAELRLRLADYLGRGWKVAGLGDDWALVSRPKSWTRPGRVLINPFYLLYAGRTAGEDRMRLTVAKNGDVFETRA
jgi:hypothetical protein